MALLSYYSTWLAHRLRLQKGTHKIKFVNMHDNTFTELESREITVEEQLPPWDHSLSRPALTTSHSVASNISSTNTIINDQPSPGIDHHPDSSYFEKLHEEMMELGLGAKEYNIPVRELDSSHSTTNTETLFDSAVSSASRSLNTSCSTSPDPKPRHQSKIQDLNLDMELDLNATAPDQNMKQNASLSTTTLALNMIRSATAHELHKSPSSINLRQVVSSQSLADSESLHANRACDLRRNKFRLPNLGGYTTPSDRRSRTSLEYTSEIPEIYTFATMSSVSEEFVKKAKRKVYLNPPPILPVQLECGFMNKDMDAETLRQDDGTKEGSRIPSHAVLNHLATSSIKHDMLGVASTTRYREKFSE